MIDYSLVQIEGALARRESRGAHLRLDDKDEQGEPKKYRVMRKLAQTHVCDHQQ